MTEPINSFETILHHSVHKEERVGQMEMPRRKIVSKTLVAMGIIIVIVSLIVFYEDYSAVLFSSFPWRPPIPLATIQSGADAAAYVMLGLGAQANQMNCPAAIESLVKHGGWAGKVFLLTDKKDCFNSDEIIKNSGIISENLKIIEVNGSFDGLDWGAIVSKMDLRKERKKSLQMKTRIFDYITDKTIQVLAFVDCDILFGIESCPLEFVSNALMWKESDNIGLRVTTLGRDQKNGKLQDLHVGTFLAHREHSKDALRMWRERMELDKEVF